MSSSWASLSLHNIFVVALATISMMPTGLQASSSRPIGQAFAPAPAQAQIQAIASAHQVLDALERLVMFVGMHPVRAAATGQGLGLAVASGALASRRDSFKSFPPLFQARLASLHKALNTVLASWRTNPYKSRLASELLAPQLWSLPDHRPAPLAANSPLREFALAPAAAPSEEEEDPGRQAAAVVLQLRALGAWFPPTPQQSDACLTRLLVGGRCDSDCAALATGTTRTRPPGGLPGGPPAAGYALTHRLLYLMLARQVGCQNIPLINGQDPISHLCSSILDEAESISSLGYPELLKDLFVEQVTLCGLAGYREFVRPSWRSAVLDWQRPSGCFGNWTAEVISLQPFLLLGDTRGDVDLGGGCLAHLTDVAAGALGVLLASASSATVESASTTRF